MQQQLRIQGHTEAAALGGRARGLTVVELEATHICDDHGLGQLTNEAKQLQARAPWPWPGRGQLGSVQPP